MKALYFFIILVFSSSICSTKEIADEENTTRGIYVIRYNLTDLEEYYRSKNSNTIKIDLEKISYYIPFKGDQNVIELSKRIIEEGVVIEENQVYILPANDLEHILNSLDFNITNVQSRINLPDKIETRLLYVINENAPFAYALYVIEAQKVDIKLENTIENRLRLNAQFNIPDNIPVINCSFIWKVDSIQAVINLGEIYSVYSPN